MKKSIFSFIVCIVTVIFLCVCFIPLLVDDENPTNNNPPNEEVVVPEPPIVIVPDPVFPPEDGGGDTPVEPPEDGGGNEGGNGGENGDNSGDGGNNGDGGNSGGPVIIVPPEDGGDDPDEPDVPVEPDVPDEPDEPDIPVEPDEPDIPVEPDEPDIPVEPDEPDIPVEPDEPDIPVEPDEPDIPVEPDEPDIPSPPVIETLATTIVVNTLPTNLYAGYTLRANSLNVTVTDANGEVLTDLMGEIVFEVGGQTGGAILLSYAASGTNNVDYCYNTVTVKYSSNSEYYYSSTTTINVKVNAIAYCGSTYFGTVESAINGVKASGSEIFVLGFDKAPLDCSKTARTISGTCTVAKGVSLNVLHNGYDASKIVEYNSELVGSAFGVVEKLKNEIFIGEGARLLNSGTINVGGVVSGGSAGKPVNSVTAGDHAQISLDKNAKITNTGIINCYGYIAETTQNNGSSLTMSGGTLTVMFTVIEHRGGGVYFGMLNPSVNPANGAITNAAMAGVLGWGSNVYTPDNLQTMPFNRFYIESVTCQLRVEAEAKVVGHAVLYANENENKTDIELISSGGSAIIHLTHSDSYVVNKFNPNTLVHDLKIYGNMELNPFILSLSVTKTVSGLTTTIVINMSSAGVYFAVSNHFDISFNHISAMGSKTNVDLSKQSVKLLPGAKVKIGENVNVTASSIAIYEDNALLNPYINTGNSAGNNTPYEATAPAELNIYGSLTAQSLGGTVTPKGPNAALSISNNKVSPKEISATHTKDQNGVEYSAKFVVNAILFSIDFNMNYTHVEYATYNLTANSKAVYLNNTITAGNLNSGRYTSVSVSGKYAWNAS